MPANAVRTDQLALLPPGCTGPEVFDRLEPLAQRLHQLGAGRPLTLRPSTFSLAGTGTLQGLAAHAQTPDGSEWLACICLGGRPRVALEQALRRSGRR